MDKQNGAQEFLELLTSKADGMLLESGLSLGDAEVRIRCGDAAKFFTLLKEDSELDFNMLVSVTAVDYEDTDFIQRAEDERYDVVYHLLSVGKRRRLRVKAAVPEEKPEIDSVTGLWDSALCMEREAWDMLGVVFKGHPDLRRILMYDEFKGHPLRKDYPVQGKQPRVALRSPEVHNTARDMQRPDLVHINSGPGRASQSS